MIIEKVTRDSYADQLTRRIIMPLGLRTTCLAPYTCPPSDAARMPTGYFFIAGAPPSLLGEAMPPIGTTTLADPAGYGLGIFQLTNAQTGTVWYYEGQAFGARVINMYFPGSGMIIALAVNSSTDNDDLGDLAVSVYQALQQAGGAGAG
jgi:D-alanyl-D-alanine carboxypeptidase